MAKNKWVDKEGNFIEPFRKAGEPRDVWQKRVEKAMLESGLFPRLNYATTLKERSKTKLNKIRQNKIDKGQSRLDELQAAKGTSGEYAASLQIPKVKESILKNRQALSPEYEDPNYEKSWEEDVAGYNLYAKDAEEHNRKETVLPEAEVDDTAPLGGRYNPGIELGQIAGGDQTMVLAGMDAKIDRQYITDKMSVKNQAAGLNQINTATNNTYVTDYQTAMKQGVPQFYGEDTLAEGPYGEKRMKKSNVFTEAAFDWGQYKEGDTLGVMGRGQREAYDRAFHEWEMKQQVENNQSTEPKKEDVKSNTNETKLTSEQTGKLPDTAGKPGTGVIDPPTNIKSPLDDPLFNVG